LSALAGVSCFALVAFVPAPAASPARPPYAHAATVFRVGECSFLSATAQEYGVFKLVLRKYQWTDGLALGQAVANAEGALATADADSDNVPAMIAEAKPALGYIADASKALDQLGLDYDRMKRVNHFANAHVTTLLDVALSGMNGDLKNMFVALSTLKGAANAYIAGNRNTGFNLYQEVVGQLTDVQNGLFARVIGEINQALADLAAGCKTATESLAPLSASEIDRDSGGGGSQRASSDGFTVLAPKRLKLNHIGRTTLPLTLTTPTTGDVQVSLTHGKTLIIYLDISQGAAHGAGGLLVNLPAKTVAGSDQLTLTFTRGSSPTEVTVKLTMRLV